MTASKRKNEGIDYVATQLTRMVIVGDGSDKENSANQWTPEALDGMTTMERLKQLNALWGRHGSSVGIIKTVTEENFRNDPVAMGIGTILEDDKSEQDLQHSLMEEAGQVQTQLTTKIERAKALYRQESDNISALSDQLNKFQEQRLKLLREIDDLDIRQRESQEKISMYQEEALEELDMVSDVEEQKKRQVPRMKMTISLYASTTGIKWDFADPDILSGQMDVPSQCSFKLFNIDPRDYSPVELADTVWDMMEGTEH